MSGCKILCRESENFADTFKCQMKSFILEQNLKKQKQVSSAETELEKSLSGEGQARERPGQNGTSFKLHHLFL